MTLSEEETIANTLPATVAPAAQPAAPTREVIYRHSLLVRLTHWLNLIFFVLLLLSGLRLFNFHPALYWGNYGYKGAPFLLAIGAARDPNTNQIVGVTQVGNTQFVTTGVLGASYNFDQDRTIQQAFPFWLTLPVDLGLRATGIRDGLAARPQWRGLSVVWPVRTFPARPRSAVRSARRATSCRTSGTTFACARRAGKPRAVTTCCRNSATLS